MTVHSQALTGTTPNWYCTRCKQPFLDATDEQPCPRCGQDDQIVGYEAPQEKKAKPMMKLAKPGERPGAIVKRATLTRSRGAVERFTAWGVLLISFAGTIAALHGGWDALLTDPSASAIVAGLLIQGGLTYVQWAYYDRHALSWGSRVIDTILTALGYSGLVLASLTRFWEARGVDSIIAGQPGAMLAAWGVIGLISFGLAWYPESRLVD